MAPINGIVPGQREAAVQYVRMSTEHQRYSIEHQTIANTAYALQHGFEIVRTYADSGVSGLTLAKRDGLKQLLADVLGGQPDFSTILVYDVSRWGRFQDPDESAHYEFICKAAGVRVVYCAELFENDGSLSSTLVKQLKRAMAAEYSRELSDRMVRTKSELGLKGYWMGGRPGYGLRRCQVDGRGTRRPYLEQGELSPRIGHRTMIVPGPAEEVAVVRGIFQLFTSRRLTPPAIARKLNADGVPFRGRIGWTQNHVRTILRNELYVGTLVIGRDRTRLGVTEKRPEEAWSRVLGACDPIIAEQLFRRAERMATRFRHRSNEELLEGLRLLIAEKGYISTAVIKNDPRTPDPNVYRFHFGSLTKAYQLVGYTMSPRQQAYSDRLCLHRAKIAPRRITTSDEEILRRLAILLQEHGALSLELIGATPGIPGREALIRRFGSIERTYALVGYAPGVRQRQCFERCRGQSRALRLRSPQSTGDNQKALAEPL